MTAAILASLGGLAILAGVVMFVVNTVRFDALWFRWGAVPGWVSLLMALTLVIDLVAAVLLIAGAGAIFRRRGAGPVLTALGCVGVIGSYLVTVFSVSAQLGWSNLGSARNIALIFGHSSAVEVISVDVRIPWAVSMSLLVFPLGTFVLAVLPSTRTWCHSAAAPIGARPAGAWTPGAQPYGTHPPVGFPPAAPHPAQASAPPQPGYGAPQGFPPPHLAQARPQDGYRP
ncbi:hypothetical protein [Nocardia asteroides]|uniref:hypothetical protein n=1 Tax=Nocardia asteroides TaxID=1824 RepID=UPI003433059B